ncbi:MAG: hypothetical protein KKA19_05765, partial [Candidatus Margulisbacteria bacterium]|nr:hypothetical protein [Candidatus Margulisiibacteriota bacterium]
MKKNKIILIVGLCFFLLILSIQGSAFMLSPIPSQISISGIINLPDKTGKQAPAQGVFKLNF